MFDKFTKSARAVMKLARDASHAFKHDFVGTEHILIGLIQEDESVAAAVLRNAFEQAGFNIDSVSNQIVPANNPTTTAAGNKLFTPRAKQALEDAVTESADMRHNYIGTEHILLGLIARTEPGEENQAVKILLNLGLDLSSIRNDTLELMGEPAITELEEAEATEMSKPRGSSKKKGGGKALSAYGRDLTKLAIEGKLDPVIGRSDEIERVILVLARRTKNNPILLGEPGVGKTAIVEGIAQQIANGKAPDTLLNHKLIALDLAAMVAGTKYRGQFEERIKAVIQEASNSNVILFVDEIHTLVGAGGAEGAIDAANVLKPALSRGEIRCIGATTLDEYRKSLEKDGALERRFQKVIIDPPTSEQTERIIFGLLEKYQAHHKVTYTRDAVKDAVRLSDRYITSRFLPDKAIDVIDEAGARAVLERHRPQDLKLAEKRLETLTRSKDEAVAAQDFEAAARIRDEMDELKEKIRTVTIEWKRCQKDTTTVDKDIIALTVAKMTGIPVQSLTETEAQKFLSLEIELDKNVIGQKSAKQALGRALRKSRAGLGNPKRPVGCFLFLGPTGVGKTLMVKEMAKILFNSEDALITLDMSEYMEKHSVSKLTGADTARQGRGLC